MENKPSSASIALKWGGIMAVAGVALQLAQFLSGSMGGFTPVSILIMVAGFVVSIGGIYMAIKEFRTANDGFLTLGQGLGVGTLAGAVSSVVGFLFQIFYTKVIDPTLMTRAMEEQFEKQGISEEAAEKAMEMMNSGWMQSLQMVFGLIAAIVISLVIALIISAILKKDKPTFG